MSNPNPPGDENHHILYKNMKHASRVCTTLSLLVWNMKHGFDRFVSLIQTDLTIEPHESSVSRRMATGYV
jgi:SUMO ligase MMS21 Smc5/6 complex component